MEHDVPMEMRALMKRIEGASYDIINMAVPEPDVDEVLIRVDAVSICGSDIVLYKWQDAAKKIATIPFIPGHETAGVVVKVGPDANLMVGDHVAVENHFYCGECYQCRHERGDICQDLGQYGHGRKTQHGGCSQYSIVPSKYCYKLQSDISMEEAALLEPLGVAHNALERCEVQNEAVLIQGCGPIGLMACALAKTMGATRVLAADISAARLGVARAMGADVTIDVSKQDLHQVVMEETSRDGIGRLCEMSGASSAINTMFSLLRKGGHVVMVGIPKQPIILDNPMQDILFKSLTLKTIHGRRIFHTWIECERLLADKKVNLNPVISHRFSLSEYERAFSVLFSGDCCKIVLDPQS